MDSIILLIFILIVITLIIYGNLTSNQRFKRKWNREVDTFSNFMEVLGEQKRTADYINQNITGRGIKQDYKNLKKHNKRLKKDMYVKNKIKALEKDG